MLDEENQENLSIEPKENAMPEEELQSPRVQPKESATKLLREITASPNRHRLARNCQNIDGYKESEEESASVKPAVHVEMVKYSKMDWISNNTYDRSVLLSILLIGYEAIIDTKKSSIKNDDWLELLTICREREPRLHNIKVVADIPWCKLKDILNPMFKRYKRDHGKNDLKRFNIMYRDAVIAWRNPVS